MSSDTLTVAHLQCRECGGPVTRESAQCPACGCKTPFACRQCDRALSSVSLGVTASKRYPYGAFDRDGYPLCHEHRLTRCHRCGRSFPQCELEKKEVGIRADTHLREGKPPRLEPIIEPFCVGCRDKALDSEPIEEKGGVLGLIVALTILVAAVIGVAILVFRPG